MVIDCASFSTWCEDDRRVGVVLPPLAIACTHFPEFQSVTTTGGARLTPMLYPLLYLQFVWTKLAKYSIVFVTLDTLCLFRTSRPFSLNMWVGLYTSYTIMNHIYIYIYIT